MIWMEARLYLIIMNSVRCLRVSIRSTSKLGRSVMKLKKVRMIVLEEGGVKIWRAMVMIAGSGKANKREIISRGDESTLAREQVERVAYSEKMPDITEKPQIMASSLLNDVGSSTPRE